MVASTETLRPRDLDEALALRTRTGATPFFGGTDLMVRHRGYTGTGPKIPGPVLFLDAIEQLQSITVADAAITIGAGVTMTQMLDHPDIPPLLRDAVELVAAPGIRNRASMAGNICNASPAGDTIPPLYVHDADVVLTSLLGSRTVPITEFFTGPGATVLAADEILTAVTVPVLPAGVWYYRKVGTRKANALSKLSAAGYARVDNGTITDFRFSVGAVAPTVIRLGEAERRVLEGARRDAVMEAAAAVIRPIDDQRSTAAYRRTVALNSLGEFLNKLEIT
ncbi:MAG: FAD binding domain-containing protein [Spirochaeta sp.]|jgi:xanthine dehydrogenase FAD-binding subunit|nr:FAD binding domain-containing protein [Spirochaeta sp.]